MKYYARSEELFLFASDGRNFSFDANACVDSRDGQEFYFNELFDRFPANTTHISYDEDTNTGGYCIDGGEEITEDGDLRCSGLKTLFDNQIAYIEGEGEE